MVKERARINIVVIGHVDIKKYTTTEQLIYMYGGDDERAIEMLKKASHEESEVPNLSYSQADVHATAGVLWETVNGIGCDEAAAINIVTSCTNEESREVA